MSACLRCSSAIEPDDLRCPVCAVATPHETRTVQRETATVLRCDGCGAALSYDAERKAPHCAFCGATMRIEQTADPLQQAQFALPFHVDEAQARAALDTFLRGGGFFHPADLAVASGVSQMQPLFWAAWVFDAEADVAYATDSDAGNGRSSWAPHAGVARMHFDRIAISASRGLTNAETDRLTTEYDLGTARDVSMIESLGPAGTAAERFELERSAARRVVAQAIESIACEDVRKGIAPGTRFRNTKVSLVLRGLVTRRLLFPAWILTYTYGGDPYRVVVHGQRPAVVIGKRPLSVVRVLAVVFGVAFVLALAALFALLILAR